MTVYQYQLVISDSMYVKIYNRGPWDIIEKAAFYRGFAPAAPVLFVAPVGRTLS